jgi:hypothetical protein
MGIKKRRAVKAEQARQARAAAARQLHAARALTSEPLTGSAAPTTSASSPFGHEHYAGQLVGLACAAVPVRPPGLWPADQ